MTHSFTFRLKEGDKNSRYFHTIVKWRRMKNSISGLLVNGKWEKDPRVVKENVKCFFKRRFQDEGGLDQGWRVKESFKHKTDVESDMLV